MVRTARDVFHFEFRELENGVFRAICPEASLSADGASLAEAESSLNRLLEERTEQIGTILAPSAVESERDLRAEQSEDDRPRR